jgi:hypothetical protein
MPPLPASSSLTLVTPETAATTPTPTAHEHARPKVLRRPASLTQPLPAPAKRRDTAIDTDAEDAAQRLPASAETHSLAWQEDGRFAALLLITLVLFNLALAAWLNAPSSAPAAPAPLPTSEGFYVLDAAAPAPRESE